ncbi:MAG: beta-galactosidase [Armatimonadota bacterium]
MANMRENTSPVLAVSEPATARFPFIFGAQYYRAPTPEPVCWAGDLRRMRELGFNAVKFFVQWRWSHRRADQFYFDDLDQLMNLAGDNGLGVTLNILLDMSPTWLFRAFPDARQIDNSGHVVEPYAVSHRSIGGHPGPCYCHPGALEARRRFVDVTIEHFRDHPALSMWDVWNEPELSFLQRTPDIRTMVCYCPNCQQGFVKWLQAKYVELERLNTVWGRCYQEWDEVEMPRVTGSINDFVDWREFHLDTMTADATWRLHAVERLDPRHGRYLHVVPVWFNAVTCVDDFAIAEPCEVFAATMNGTPAATIQVVSAARGKTCYNVESHLNHGYLNMHQPIVDAETLRRDFLPQIGLGIKGFLFWQYRPEVLGNEAPSWGLVRLDGSDRPVTQAAQAFWSTLQPYANDLLHARPATPRVGIWKSRKNEIFHFCTQDSVQPLSDAIEAYTQALYWRSIPFEYVSGQRLEAGEIDELSLLIMPSGYYLTDDETAVLDRWVHAGGVLLTEAHLAGYSATSGRHSRILPGGGLAASWGLRETESTSSYHLRLDDRQAFTGTLPEDVRKALDAFGVTGGQYYPIRLASGEIVWGAHRYAELTGDQLTPEGSFTGTTPCLASVAVGQGRVFYCGASFGLAAERSDAGLQAMLDKALAAADVQPVCRLTAEQPGSIHLDLLTNEAGARFAVVINRTDQPQQITLEGRECWRGIFTGLSWRLAGFTDVSVPARCSEFFALE